MNNIIKFIIFITFIIFINFINCFPVLAGPEEISSEGYKIKMPNLNMAGGRKEGSGKTVTDTLGQTAPGRYAKDGYIVRAGFQYIYSIVPFTFTITDLTIDFGILVPGTPATASNQLIVSTGSAGGYQISAFENNPLKLTEAADTIPNTICDDGLCTAILATLWTNANVHGFGFNASGDDVMADFGENKYRQFSDASLATPAAVIMSRDSSTYNPPSHTRTGTITYKVNIPASQPAGKYENAVTFIATPKY